MSNRITTFERNCQVEAKHEEFVIECIKRHYCQKFKLAEPEVVVQKETRAAYQKKGVDFRVYAKSQPVIYVDVKVRTDVERYWPHKCKQDIAIEYSQSGGFGWANNPNYITNDVIWVYPDLKDKSFKEFIVMPHSFLQYITTGRVFDFMKRKQYNWPFRQGDNGAAFSYFFTLPADKIGLIADAWDWKDEPNAAEWNQAVSQFAC